LHDALPILVRKTGNTWLPHTSNNTEGYSSRAKARGLPNPRPASICTPPGPWVLGSTIARKVSRSGSTPNSLAMAWTGWLISPMRSVASTSMSILNCSGSTLTPCATRLVSQGKAKSYPPLVPGALPVVIVTERVRLRVSGLNSNSRISGGMLKPYSTSAPLVTLGITARLLSLLDDSNGHSHWPAGPALMPGQLPGWSVGRGASAAVRQPLAGRHPAIPGGSTPRAAAAQYCVCARQGWPVIPDSRRRCEDQRGACPSQFISRLSGTKAASAPS